MHLGNTRVGCGGRRLRNPKAGALQVLPAQFSDAQNSFGRQLGDGICPANTAAQHRVRRQRARVSRRHTWHGQGELLQPASRCHQVRQPLASSPSSAERWSLKHQQVPRQPFLKTETSPARPHCGQQDQHQPARPRKLLEARTSAAAPQVSHAAAADC
jgi:hypothetical protein